MDLNEIQVDPVKVIALLKSRIAEEAAKSALFEVAYQESRAREADLEKQVQELRPE